ncbi:hypothetical protein SUGI_0701700 [Cryptomeria japonica]|nr:hypothetical protein SUGI_0701700 [Cryptomeria japonica]
MMECFQFYQDRIKLGLAKKYICFLQDRGISIYDPLDQSCEILPWIPTISTISECSEIISVNHKIFLLGRSYVSTVNIWVYDLSSITWKRVAEIPTARSGTDFAFCASPEGTIYIAGGFTKIRPGHALREAAVYKIDEDKWELLPEMHQEIDSCRGVFIEGIFYVIGRDNRTQRFDPTTRVWTTIVNMSWNHIFWNNFLYAFGRLSLFTARNGIE